MRIVVCIALGAVEAAASSPVANSKVLVDYDDGKT